jgi:hypothetical protein
MATVWRQFQGLGYMRMSANDVVDTIVYKPLGHIALLL